MTLTPAVRQSGFGGIAMIDLLVSLASDALDQLARAACPWRSLTNVSKTMPAK
jgi:hypothetical protein